MVTKSEESRSRCVETLLHGSFLLVVIGIVQKLLSISTLNVNFIL